MSSAATSRPTPWHNSTLAVVGASAAGIAVIGVLVGAVMFMSGGDEPVDAPLQLRRPVLLARRRRNRHRRRPPRHRPSPAPRRSPPPRSTDRRDRRQPRDHRTPAAAVAKAAAARRSHGRATREFDENPGGPTSRRPRFNITRTLGPGPIGLSAYYRCPWLEMDLMTRTTTRTVSPPPTPPTTATTAVISSSRANRPSRRRPGTASPRRSSASAR